MIVGGHAMSVGFECEQNDKKIRRDRRLIENAFTRTVTAAAVYADDDFGEFEINFIQINLVGILKSLVCRIS
jgi:hypothetical protein